MWIDNENKQFEKGTFGPDVATDYLIDFIISQKEKPFFAYYPMILPHSPFVPTPNSKKQTNKNQQQNFEDMVAYVDHLVGRIVDAVEDAGLGKNTLIIFTGDNGTHQRIKSTLNGSLPAFAPNACSLRCNVTCSHIRVALLPIHSPTTFGATIQQGIRQVM